MRVAQVCAGQVVATRRGLGFAGGEPGARGEGSWARGSRVDPHGEGHEGRQRVRGLRGAWGGAQEVGGQGTEALKSLLWVVSNRVAEHRLQPLPRLLKGWGHGGTGAWGQGGTGTQGYGDTRTWGHRDTGKQGHGDMGVQGHGDTGTWGHVDMSPCGWDVLGVLV